MITLRPICAADFTPELERWYSNADGHLAYFSGSGRSFPLDAVAAEAADLLRTRRGEIALVSYDGHPVGTCKIGPIDALNKQSDLVMLIGDRERAGKGTGSIAIKVASEYAIQRYGLRVLRGGIMADNIASLKAYTRAGWKEEGRLAGFYLRDGRPMDRILVCYHPQALKPEGGE